MIEIAYIHNPGVAYAMGLFVGIILGVWQCWVLKPKFLQRKRKSN